MNAPFRPSAVTVRLARLAEGDERARIERYVAAQAEGTPFHRPAWIEAVARGTKNGALALVAERGGTVVGYLPLVDVRSQLFGRAMVSSGFAVGGGTLANDAETASLLVQSAEETAREQDCAVIELRGGGLPQGGEGWTIRSGAHCGFVRTLEPTDDAQLNAIPRKQRAEVRKSLANDLTVEIGTSASDRAAHYAVYAESVRNLGTPVFPRRLFSEVLDAFGEDADILTVSHHGKPVASVLSLYHGGAVMPYWGGGTREARRLRANDRMYYELMLHARRRGCDRFDFGRSKTGSGAYDFKRNWGFEPQPLSYAIWTAPGAKPRDTDPTSESHSAKIELWKRLPLPVANLIGPWIARGLG